jgi:phosphoheptose isomerase
MIKQEWVNEYLHKQVKTISLIDQTKVEKALNIIQDCIKNNKMIFFAGNGGSLSNIQHAVCDINKGASDVLENFAEQSNDIISSDKLNRIKGYALGTNPSLSSAYCNDYSYQEALWREMANFAEEGDVLVGRS